MKTDFQIARFDEELISLLPKSLKLIAIGAAGFDNVDLVAASKKGSY